MPRQQTVNVEKLCDSLIKFKEFLLDSNSKVVTPSNAVWTDVAKDLNGALTPGAIYTIFKKNRYNVWDTVKLIVEPSAQQALRKMEEECDSDSKTSVNSEEDNSFLTFEIELSDDQKEKLGVLEKNYLSKDRRRGFRTYTTFRAGWTHVLNDIFWKKTLLPCTVIFKRAKINKFNHNFAKVSGKCKECKSILSVVFLGGPNAEDKMKISCKYSGNYLMNHIKNYKRPLSSTLREEAVSKMITNNVTPSFYRQIKASEMMEDGSCEPSHLPKITTLNVAKHESISKTWLDKNPVIGLSIAKSFTQYKNVIRDIGLDRFFVHYWSTIETEVYRSYCKRSVCSQIAIDATGSVVRKIRRPSGADCKHIFLYEVVVLDEEITQQYSVAHMLSERHDANSISHWLIEWLRSGATVPKIVVVDMSLALLSGVARAFTQYNSINNYLRACCNALFNNREINFELPSTFIRLDVAHLIKLITRWKSFKNAIGRTKEFYVRAMGQALKALTLTDLEKILTAIIVVALGETEGNDSDNNQVPCEIEKIFLKNIVATGSQHNIEENVTDVSEVPEIEITSLNDETEFRHLGNEFEFYNTKLWVESIITKVRLEIEGKIGDRGNQQYLPDLVSDLMGIANFIPLWSAVMVPVFGYGHPTASSSSVESNFNNLKNRVFAKHLLPMRVDDFVLRHITAIDGGMKLAKASIQKLNQNFGNCEQTLETAEPILKTCDINCNMCEAGNAPSGVHDCINCEKRVHVTEPCSFPAAGEEGFGRFCNLNNSVSIVELQSTENWRGLTEKDKPLKKRKWSYLLPNPDWLNIDLNNTTRKKGAIGVLKNGGKHGLKPVKLDNDMYIVQNTCAYDSLVQLLCTALNDDEHFNNILNSSNETVLLCRDILKNGIHKATYKKRANILKNYFEPEELQNNLKLLSVECPILEMVKKIFPEIISMKTSSICSLESCSEKEKYYNDTTISVFCNPEELKKLHLKISELINEKNYTPCGNNCAGIRATEKIIGNNYFLLELFDSKQNYTDISVKLYEIPQTLSLTDRSFELKGVIGYIGSASYNPLEVGHYVCYSLRPPNWIKYDNLNTRSMVVSKNEKIKVQLLLYTKKE